MSTISFSPEKRELIVAHRALDEARDQELDAWDVFGDSVNCPDRSHREEAANTLAQATTNYEAAILQYAEAVICYRAWWESTRSLLTLAAESATLKHLAS